MIDNILIQNSKLLKQLNYIRNEENRFVSKQFFLSK